eukprot:sb/3475074/
MYHVLSDAVESCCHFISCRQTSVQCHGNRHNSLNPGLLFLISDLLLLLLRVPGLAYGKPTRDCRRAISPALEKSPPTPSLRMELPSGRFQYEKDWGEALLGASLLLTEIAAAEQDVNPRFTRSDPSFNSK